MLGSLFYTITAKTEPLKQKLSEAQTSMKNTDKTMRSTGKSITDTSGKMSGAAGNALGTMENGLSSISPAAGSAVSGMKSMSVAARGLNMALGPIGLIILAIGLAVKALSTYFKSSVDGQQKMATIMAYLRGAADALKDAFIAVGRWIVWAFENPKKAIADLWEMIKKNLINRFKGLIDMITSGWEVISKGAKGVGLAIKGIFNKEARVESKKAFEEMADGMVDFGKAVVMASTGIDLNNDKLKKLGKAATERAEASAALQRRENDLKMVEIASLTKIATLDRDIANLRLITNDTTAEGVKRLEAANKVEELIAQKYDLRLAMKREEVAIQQQRNDLGENAIEDEEAIAKLNAELITLVEQRANEERAVLRIKGTVVKEVEAQKKAELDAIWAVQDAKTQAQAEELIGRQTMLAEIDNASKSNVDKLYDELNQKLNAYEWSQAEELRIMQHYSELISAEQKAKAAETSKLWQGVTDVMSGAFAGAFEQIGAVMAGAQGDFKGLVSTALNSISQIINALLAQAIAAMIARESTRGLLGLATAAVGVGVLKALWAKNVPQMAKGGVIPPGYPNDTYPALLSSGETVTPPRALATGGGQLTARISRRDLLFILDEAGAERGRTW